MKKNKDDRSELTRISIQEAFLQLLAVKSYQNISITEIMDKAGYNRGTFYEYFKDKKTLFLSIEDDYLTNEKNIHQLIEVIRTQDQKLLQTKIVELIQKNDFFLTAVINSGELSRFFQIFLDKAIPVTLDSIRKKTTELGYQFDETYYRAYLRFVLVGFVTLIIQWYQDDKPVTLDELFLMANDFFKGVPLVPKK